MLLSIVISSLLLCSLSVAVAPPLRRDPIHMPMTRRRHVRRGKLVDLDHYARVATRLRARYKQDLSVSRRAEADFSLTNQVRLISGVARPRFFISNTNNNRIWISATLFQSVSVLRKCYYSECCCPPSYLALPLSAQTFNLALDTGGSDFWFASTGCVTCPEGTPELDPTTSSTIQIGNQAVTFNYGSGSASGTIAQDTVSMGAFTVNPQVFGANSPFFIDFRLFEEYALCSAKSW